MPDTDADEAGIEVLPPPRRRRPPRLRHRPPPLSVPQILAWADHHKARTGRWPISSSGAVADGAGESWQNVNAALRMGLRGLNRGLSLARLLAEHRGVRNRMDLPPLTEALILRWADAFHARTGGWPGQRSGPIHEAPGESRKKMHAALYDGRRGLPGGSTLAQLLASRRGVRNIQDLPPLTVEGVLAWCDAFKGRSGRWPGHGDGAIPEAQGETWCGVEDALRDGRRGLPGGSSLAQLLSERRGLRNTQRLPPLTAEQILAWADAHKGITGRWPTRGSGPVTGAPGETWYNVAAALVMGQRGLPAGSSLARLLQAGRGVRNRKALPRLSLRRVRAWAKAHERREGRWPDRASGPIPEAPGETWAAVVSALDKGGRGLPRGWSLARLRRGLASGEEGK